MIAIIALLTVISGYLLSENSSAAWPYVDSFTTWASVLTTYLVTQKYLQSWLYWVVIDAVSIPLYIDRGLTLTALLFVFYVVIAVFGYFKWRQHLRTGEQADAA
jgi:nicotinamide mononucleotide transporter